MEARLIKIDRNGSKHYEGMVECDRCQGRGWYATGVRNGELVPSCVDDAVCYKCHGLGKVKAKWIERTPEYQAKLDAKRQAKLEAIQAEQERLRQEAEKERLRKEALKAISQYVGEIGQKLEMDVCYEGSGSWEQRAYAGYGTVTMYAHTFKDVDGNVIVWKTQTGVDLHRGEPIHIKGTVKDHSEYQGQKQTALTRCTVKEIK